MLDWTGLSGANQNALTKLDLEQGSRYYVSVRSQNRAGLRSAVVSSDGVIVGKNEVTPAQDEQTVVGFDTQRTDGKAPANAPPGEQKQTVGALSVPPAGVKKGVSLVAGVLAPNEFGDDTSGEEFVDPGTVPKPANNFKFGEYSFAIQAKDEEGEHIDGYINKRHILRPHSNRQPHTTSLLFDVVSHGLAPLLLPQVQVRGAGGDHACLRHWSCKG